MESLFFPPSSSFFSPSPTRPPRARGVNCVHFNYDLISGGWGGRVGSAGELVCWHASVCACMCGSVCDHMCGCGWVVCRGHNLRTGCYWVSVVPPESQSSLSSNDPPPPEDPRTHTHEHKSQATLRHASLMHPLLSLCFLTLPPLFPSVFHLAQFVFFFSPSSATCPPTASGENAGVLTP